MTSTGTALSSGTTVITPSGARGLVEARHGGPLTMYRVLGHWWSESQLSLPEDTPAVHRCRTLACRRGDCNNCGAGLIVDGQPSVCACPCHTEADD